MSVKSIDLIWVAVKDLKKAVKFYTEVVGLDLLEIHEQFGWAELGGKEGGAMLGIAQIQPESEKEKGCPMKAGQNAFITFTVDDIDQATEELTRKGATTIGARKECSGHVKIQDMVDLDGNHFQIVQKLEQCC